MFKKSNLYVKNAEFGQNFHNSRFIQRVREEHNHDQVVEDAYENSTNDNPYNRKVQSAINLCSEVKELAREKFIEEKRRQQLRSNNQELKQLEMQLRAAYIKKATEAQLFEQKAVKEELVVSKNRSEEMLTLARLNYAEAEKKHREEELAKKESLKKDLQVQMEETKAKRLKEYQKIMNDQQAMADAKKKLIEDIQRENREATEMRHRNKVEMEEAIRAQHEWRMSQNQATEKENQRIQELMLQRELEQQRIKQEKMERKLRKQQISEEIGKQIHEIAMKKARERDTIAELLTDERQAKEEIMYRENLERQETACIANHRALKLEIEGKERRKLEQQKLDQALFQEEMRNLAERDKLDQLSDEKRKRKQMEHRRALQQSLNDQKMRKAESMQQHLFARETDFSEAKAHQQQVDEERIRILTEHAPDLLGYLAPGVLRESERKFLSTLPKKNY